MRPDVNQMDERNGERDGADVYADPKKLTFTKLFEIDKQDGCDEENEQQQQMNHLTFEEKPAWDQRHPWHGLFYIADCELRRNGIFSNCMGTDHDMIDQQLVRHVHFSATRIPSTSD